MIIKSIELAPEDINKAYHDLLYRTIEQPETLRRYELIYGGAGSGKSYFTAQRKVLQMLMWPKRKTLVVRKVLRTQRHSTYALILSIIANSTVSHLFAIKRSDFEIHCAATDSMITFVGMDDPEKVKSIHGITDVWIEEATELSKEDFTQLDLRLRGETKYPKQITLTFNPVSAQSWIKQRFFDHPDENTTILKTTYQDNRFIDDEYSRVIEDLKHQDPIYYSVYGLGEWGVLGNLILTNWAAERGLSQDPYAYDLMLHGMDFGFNHASAFLRIGMKDNELYILDEVYERGLTNPELVQLVKPKIGKNDRIIADSAEPARIEEFKRAGIKMQPAKKGPDSVKAGIDWLRRHKIHIDADRCPNTIAEIQAWKYREDRDGVVYEEPVAFKDDAMAALRYAVEPLRTGMQKGEVKRFEW